MSLTAPLYSTRLVGPDGKPVLLGRRPVVFDDDSATSLTVGLRGDRLVTYQGIERCPHSPTEVCRCPKPWKADQP